MDQDVSTIQFFFMLGFPVVTSIAAIALMGFIVRMLLGGVKPDPTRLARLAAMNPDPEPVEHQFTTDMTGRVHMIPAFDYRPVINEKAELEDRRQAQGFPRPAGEQFEFEKRVARDRLPHA